MLFYVKILNYEASRGQSTENETGESCITRGEKRAYDILVGRHEGKRSLESLNIDGRVILK
jgi:hypothetical protein